MPSDAPLYRYSITVSGYDPVYRDARSASAARYSVYKAFCEATNRLPFRDFLDRVTTLHFGKVKP